MSEKNKDINGKEYTEGIALGKNKFLMWLDNFWYHYKWPTIVISFFLLVFIVCTVQMCTKKPTDIFITYAGSTSFSAIENESSAGITEKEAIQTVLKDYLPDNFSENRNPYLTFQTYNVLSQSEIKELEEEQNESMNSETDENGEPKEYFRVSESFYKEQLDEFYSWLGNGTSSIYLLSPWLYEEVAKTERLMTLTEIFGEKPENAVGDFGIRLGDTNMYKDNPELQILPADTVICMQKQTFWQSGKGHNKELEAFKAYATAPQKDGENS